MWHWEGCAYQTGLGWILAGALRWAGAGGREATLRAGRSSRGAPWAGAWSGLVTPNPSPSPSPNPSLRTGLEAAQNSGTPCQPGTVASWNNSALCPPGLLRPRHLLFSFGPNSAPPTPKAPHPGASLSLWVQMSSQLPQAARLPALPVLLLVG